MNSQQRTLRERSGPNRLTALFVMLACMVGLAQSASAVIDASANFDMVSSALVAESCVPNNSAFDPGETETVTFVIKKTTDGTLSNVKVSLVADAAAGVTFVSPQQVVGDMAKDALASVTFSFVNMVSCNGQLNLTLRITSGANDAPVAQGDLTFGPFSLGTIVETPHVFSNTANIEIKDSATPPTKANPYPSSINVANVSGTVHRVVVTLKNITHSFSGDVDVVLQGPTGHSVTILSDAGISQLGNVTLVLDTEAPATLPIESSTDNIASGTYATVNNGVGPDTFPDGPTPGTADLRTFGNLNPNGDWKLFVVDDSTGASGNIAGGWDLDVRTRARVCCLSGLPTIAGNNVGAPIPNVELNEDAPETQVSFFVNSTDFTASQLTVAAFSSDQSIIPDSSFKIEGTSNDRTLKFKPAANGNGTATITLRVTAPNGNSATTQFQVKVNAVNDAPFFQNFFNQAFNSGISITPVIPFGVGDVESGPDSVTLVAESNNTGLVPNVNIFLGGSGANRTVQLQLTRAAVAGDTVNITITALDPVNPALTTSQVMTVTFDVTPGAPTISPIANVTVEENKSATTTFVVGDANTPAGQIQLSATSSDTSIIPATGLAFGGSDSIRTLTITPAANQNTSPPKGPVTVTITARNNNNVTFNRPFTVTVTPVNSVPSISQIGPQSINEEATSAAVPFTVGDAETAAADVNVTVLSVSDTTTIPLNTVILTEVSAGNWTVRFSGGPNAFGKSVITLRADDGTGGFTNMSFEVTVVPVNDPPTIGDLTHPFYAAPVDETNFVSIPEDAGEQTVTVNGITVGPANETGQTLTLTATSDKPAIIKNPTISYTSPNSTGLVKFTPEKDQSGTVIITVTVTDNGGTANGGNNAVSKKFRVEVNPVNDPPTLSDVPTQNAGLGENIVVQVTVADIDSDVNTLTLSAVRTAGADVVDSFQFAGVGPSRIIGIDTDDTAGGTATITYTVTDPSGASTSKTFTLNVSNVPPNQQPTFTSTIGDLTIPEDTFITTGTFNVDDPDGPESDLTVTGRSDNQTLISDANIVANCLTGPCGAARNLLIVPNKDAAGTVVITVTVTDKGDANGFNKKSASFTFKLILSQIEDEPVILMTGSTTVTTNEDTPTGEGSNGSDTASNELEFTARDAETLPANLTFQISSGNTDLIPVGSGSIPGVGGTAGAVTISAPLGDGTRRSIEIAPASNRNGSTTVTIRVVDQIGLSSAITLTVTVNAVNDKPTLDPITDVSFPEVTADTTRTVTLTGVTRGGGSDESGQVLSFTVTSGNTALVDSLSVGAVGSDNRANLSFRQRADQSGQAKITVEIFDNAGGSEKREFFVNVGAVNAAPTITGTGANGAIPDVAINQGGSSSIISFTVADAPNETPAANLILTATSSNEALLPASGLVLGGSGGTRSIRITPNPNQFGIATVTITVTDTGLPNGTDVKSVSRTFTVTVNQVQQNPVVSVIPDITTQVNVETDIISFTVSDQESPAANLIVSAVSSSNPTLIPLQNVQFGGSGGTRLMIVIPAQDQSGQSTVTIRVTDTDSPTPHFTDRAFKVTVERLNNEPTITSIADQIIDQNSSTGPLAFRVADAETAAGLLEITAASSDQTVVPNANIAFGGTRNDRTVTVPPAPNQSGSSRITITVKDSGSPPGNPGNAKTATTAFTVTVRSGPANTPPTISPKPIAGVIVNKNQPTPVIPFTVSDAQTALGFLVVTAQSSNPTLIPVGNVFFGGSAGNRTVFITPGVDQLGTATITLTVTDAGGLTDSTTVQVTVIESVPVGNPHDFNGDGKPDLMFEDNAGFVAVWFMDSVNLISASLLNPNNTGDPNWRLVAAGDFNGDGKPDLLFQNIQTGDLAVWYMNGISLTSPTLLNPANPGPGWRAVGLGDFNGDGNLDILLQQNLPGQNDPTLAVWYMNGVNLNSPTLLSPSSPGAGWSAVAVADLNRDGNPDIVFQDGAGTLAAWYMNGVDLNSATLLNPASSGPEWRVTGSTDLNGDLNADLLFQNSTDASLATWFLNGVDLIRGTLLNPSNPGGTWQLLAP